MRRIETASMPSVSATRIATDASSARPRRGLRAPGSVRVQRSSASSCAATRPSAAAALAPPACTCASAWASLARAAAVFASIFASAAASFACVFAPAFASFACVFVSAAASFTRVFASAAAAVRSTCSAIRSSGSRVLPERDEELLAMSYSVLLRSRTMYETTTPRPDVVSPAPASGGVTTNGLGKRFGDLWALRDLDLHVEPGTILGLLGHNGAGKTTAIRILTTLSRPTEGSATVAGIDVAAHPELVREQIGVASQTATVDDLMTATLNLVTIGRLRGMSKIVAAQRSEELLEQLDLTDFASALVRTYSGGMRRRLDLAASLMGDPPVLFLDEPTTGLDPVSRNHLWDMLDGLVSRGATVILTTQYLEEADRMADDIVVLDHGKTVAHGTPSELKLRVGGNRLDVTFAPGTDLAIASRAVEPFVDRRPAVDDEARVLTLPIRDGVRSIEVLRALDDAGLDAVDVTRREVTLDDVFLTLTGARPVLEETELLEPAIAGDRQ